MLLEPSSGASILKKQAHLHRWLKKRQISRYCRHILTFPVLLNFIMRSTSFMVLKLSSVASSLKKQEQISKADILQTFLTFPLHLNFISRSIFHGSQLSSGASILKKQGHHHRLLKNVRYQAIAETYFDNSSSFEVFKLVFNNEMRRTQAKK